MPVKCTAFQFFTKIPNQQRDGGEADEKPFPTFAPDDEASAGNAERTGIPEKLNLS
jgi:hypothetical protein